MKFLKDLLSHTLTGKIFLTIKYLIAYLKDYDYISDSFYSDAFKTVIKEYLGVTLKKDWIGRLYAVINPNINKDGQFDISKTILEFDGDNTNNNEYLKHWVYKQLTLIGDVFSIKNLYNYIDLKFTHVGPIEADNFLLIFDVVSRKQFIKSLKETLLHGFIYLIIALVVFLII